MSMSILRESLLCNIVMEVPGSNFFLNSLVCGGRGGGVMS